MLFLLFQVSEKEGEQLDNSVPTAKRPCDNDPATISSVAAILDVPDVMAHVKVENYLMQLSALPLDPMAISPEPLRDADTEQDALESPPPVVQSPTPLVSVSGGPKSGRQQRASDRQASDEDGNVSVGSSRVSRMSDLSNLTGRFSQCGAFHGSILPSSTAAPVCPFPDEWQYNTIPEVIENDEDID
jgi:hypothetical protein